MSRPRILCLGTGGAANVRRNQACLLVQRAAPTAAPILLDTGHGLNVVRSLLAAGIDPLSIEDVFISHRHPDHAGGIDPLLLWRRIQVLKRGAPIADAGLRVYSEPRTLRALREAFAVQASGTPAALGEALQWLPLLDGQPTALPDGRLVPFLVDHLPVDGGAMGCVVEVDGVRIAYSGDTRPSDRLAEVAQGADVLLHECGGLDQDAKQVHRPCHSTAGDAGRVARAAGVKRLILTHIADDDAVPAMLAEAQAAFGGPVTMAEDGLAFAL
ncbi:MAG: MBL fold metallo-hydrolase [Chloroflexi bacterium]|nr:MBL fold metallo-hydrolase [Chloroflexota bacterium]